MSTETETEFAYPFGVSRTVAAVGTVVVMLLVPGFAVHFLTTAGYSTLADVAWVVSYGGGALLVWRIWIRPLDLAGSGGHNSTETADSNDVSATSTNDTTPR